MAQNETFENEQKCYPANIRPESCPFLTEVYRIIFQSLGAMNPFLGPLDRISLGALMASKGTTAAFSFV